MSQPKKHFLRVIWGLLIAAAILAVAWNLTGEATAADSGADGMAAGVLAKVGDLEVSEDEVKQRVAAGLLDIDRKRYELMERGLNAVVEEKLIELEAAARGVTAEALIETEVTGKVQTVGDEDIDAFYEARKAQIGREKAQVADQIRQYLEQQRGAESRSTFVNQLRAKYEVETFLDPLRIMVDASGSPAKGPENAPVTIVEFSDFECPFCSRVVPTLDQLTEKYGDKIRLVFRQFPLHAIHPNAQKAAEASLCANDQEKFWEMHDAMFAKQRELGVDQLKQRAAELELDLEKFNACLDSDRYADQVAADLEAGQQAGVSGTPALFINGRFLSGAQPFDVIANVVDDELRRAGM